MHVVDQIGAVVVVPHGPAAFAAVLVAIVAAPASVPAMMIAAVVAISQRSLVRMRLVVPFHDARVLFPSCRRTPPELSASAREQEAEPCVPG
jgi:hypothetical protein